MAQLRLDHSKDDHYAINEVDNTNKNSLFLDALFGCLENQILNRFDLLILHRLFQHLDADSFEVVSHEVALIKIQVLSLV